MNDKFPNQDEAEAMAKEFAHNWFPMSFHERDRGAMVSAMMQFYWWMRSKQETKISPTKSDGERAEEYIDSVKDGIHGDLWPLLEKDSEIMRIAFIRGLLSERALAK